MVIDLEAIKAELAKPWHDANISLDTIELMVAEIERLRKVEAAARGVLSQLPGLRALREALNGD